MAPRHDETNPWSSENPKAESWLEDAISRDPALDRLLPNIRRLAASDTPVLIVGEAGTGRELVARAIHNLSARRGHPFVVIDCSSLSGPLIEAELLGVNGGQPPHKVGALEQAGAGTALLAEVGELPPRVQEILLRLLERHEIVRLNATAPIRAQARILASTSIDLRARVGAGLFRQDLHDRLATELLTIAPLRERKDDVPTLARHFCSQLGRGARQLSSEAEARLREYSWPGNIRELREVVEQAAMKASGDRIGVEDLPERVRREGEAGPLPSLRDVEMRHIERVLQEARGNQRRASRILGISRWSLSRRLRKYGMQPRTEE